MNKTFVFKVEQQNKKRKHVDRATQVNSIIAIKNNQGSYSGINLQVEDK